MQYLLYIIAIKFINIYEGVTPSVSVVTLLRMLNNKKNNAWLKSNFFSGVFQWLTQCADGTLKKDGVWRNILQVLTPRISNFTNSNLNTSIM